MLPSNKHWLQNEMNKIEAQIKCDKKNKKDNVIMFQFLCCLFVLFFSVASADDFFFTCPYCRCSIEAEIKDNGLDEHEMKIKNGTWKCPKKTCGYRNDNRIRYCSMCGAERQ